MNITLISLSSAFTPIGLRTISSSLKIAGHSVKLVFMPREVDLTFKRGYRFNYFPIKTSKEYDEKKISALLELSKNSDLIGISLSTNFFEDATQITKALRKELKISIIWGGIHPTIKPKECLQYADIVCRGEGEEAIVELAEKIEKKENYHNVKNICFKDSKGNFIINPVRPLIQNLDFIPFQSFDFKNEYVIIKGKSYEVDEKIILNDNLWPFGSDERSIYRIMYTRGCTFGCTYCCNNFLNNLYSGQKIFRKRSVDNVIEELRIAKNNLSFIEFISFEDDNFLGLSLEEIKEFSKKYKKNIKIPFCLSGVHPNTVDKEKFKYLIDAGLTGIRMGIQSGSDRIKKMYKRYYSNSKVKESCEIISEFKDKIALKHYDIILDNPWETEEDLIKTLMLLSNLPVPYELVLFFLTFFPETELYNLAKKDGFIRNEFQNVYRKNYWENPSELMSYINSLFILLKDSVGLGERILPEIMSLLTNKTFRKLGLSLFLYYILVFRIKLVKLYKKRIKNF